jgi:hypothetical protein
MGERVARGLLALLPEVTRPVLSSKLALLLGGWLALTSALVGGSGIAGETVSGGLVVFGAGLALAITRGPRRAR